MALLDPVRWSDHALPGRCSRCRQPVRSPIRPYYNRALPICTQCCTELETLYAHIGWPAMPAVWAD